MRSLCTGGAWLVLFSPRLFPLVPALINLTFIFPHPKSISIATEYDCGSVITILDTKEARKLLNVHKYKNLTFRSIFT